MVTLASSATSVPLICIGSKHSETLQYVWVCGDSVVGICSPVLYATKPGRYTCTVSDEYEYSVKSKEIIVIQGRIKLFTLNSICLGLFVAADAVLLRFR